MLAQPACCLDNPNPVWKESSPCTCRRNSISERDVSWPNILIRRDNPRNEPARRPAHQEKLAGFGGVIEIAPRTSNARHVGPLAGLRHNSWQYCPLFGRIEEASSRFRPGLFSYFSLFWATYDAHKGIRIPVAATLLPTSRPMTVRSRAVRRAGRSQEG
jgi:hypothetical protein